MDTILCTSANEAETRGRGTWRRIVFRYGGYRIRNFYELPSPSLTFIVVFLSFPRPSNLSWHPPFTLFFWHNARSSHCLIQHYVSSLVEITLIRVCNPRINNTYTLYFTPMYKYIRPYIGCITYTYVRVDTYVRTYIHTHTHTHTHTQTHTHIYIYIYIAVAQWLRCCATNRKVAGSIQAGVSGFFIDIKFLRSHYVPGVYSFSNRNEYQEYFLGVKAVGA